MATDTGTTAGVEWVGHPDEDPPLEVEPTERPKLGVGDRVAHFDYGRGTIVLSHGTLLQVLWDRPLLDGVLTRMLDHDASFALQLTRLVTDADGRESPVP